jgi:hypothetical protein
MNVRFVVRGLLLALPVAVLTSAAWILTQTPLGLSPAATPPPATILAPAGEAPAGTVGLREFVQYQGEGYRPAGSGFLLSLADASVVGVTTAHGVSLDSPERPLRRIALGVDGQSGFVTEHDVLRGLPGRPRTGDDLTVDYLLLHVVQPVEARFLLTPDPRGAPQPGERVLLYSGVADGDGGQRILGGTVQSASDTAIWVLMDQLFNPYRMSGSPVISEHTGQAVGMAVAVSPRRNRLLVGVHPIGSLVQLAEEATGFPSIGE